MHARCIISNIRRTVDFYFYNIRRNFPNKNHQNFIREKVIKNIPKRRFSTRYLSSPIHRIRDSRSTDPINRNTCEITIAITETTVASRDRNRIDRRKIARLVSRSRNASNFTFIYFFLSFNVTSNLRCCSVTSIIQGFLRTDLRGTFCAIDDDSDIKYLLSVA